MTPAEAGVALADLEPEITDEQARAAARIFASVEAEQVAA